MYLLFGSGRRGWRGGEWMRGLGLGFTNSVGRGRVLDVCLCFGCCGVSGVGGLDQAWSGDVMFVSPDYLCIWQVHVSVYCGGRIPPHLRCTQCAILLHLIDIVPCICLWQISQIKTSLCVVVGPGFVSTSPAFMMSSASHPAGPHDRLAPPTVNLATIAWGGMFGHNLHSSL